MSSFPFPNYLWEPAKHHPLLTSSVGQVTLTNQRNDGGSWWVPYLFLRGDAAFSCFLESLRTQCDFLERSRIKMLRTLEAKRLAAMESSVNLPARSPKGGGTQQSASQSSQQKVCALLTPQNFLSKSHVYVHHLTPTSLLLPSALESRNLSCRASILIALFLFSSLKLDDQMKMGRLPPADHSIRLGQTFSRDIVNSINDQLRAATTRGEHEISGILCEAFFF